MTQLTDTQLVILSAAGQRPNRLVLPLPERLKGGAAHKVVRALMTRGLIEEIDAGRGDPVWRDTGDGHGVTLVATDAALDALGIEADPAPTGADSAADGAGDALQEADPATASTAALTADAGADEAPTEPAARKRGRPKKAATTGPATGAPRKSRDGSKQALLIAMLERPEGATIAQIVATTGWQPHTVRGAIAGALKKKLGLTITSEKIEGERTYRIAR